MGHASSCPSPSRQGAPCPAHRGLPNLACTPAGGPSVPKGKLQAVSNTLDIIVDNSKDHEKPAWHPSGSWRKTSLEPRCSASCRNGTPRGMVCRNRRLRTGRWWGCSCGARPGRLFAENRRSWWPCRGSWVRRRQLGPGAEAVKVKGTWPSTLSLGKLPLRAAKVVPKPKAVMEFAGGGGLSHPRCHSFFGASLGLHTHYL